MSNFDCNFPAKYRPINFPSTHFQLQWPTCFVGFYMILQYKSLDYKKAS